MYMSVNVNLYDYQNVVFLPNFISDFTLSGEQSAAVGKRVPDEETSTARPARRHQTETGTSIFL